MSTDIYTHSAEPPPETNKPLIVNVPTETPDSMTPREAARVLRSARTAKDEIVRKSERPVRESAEAAPRQKAAPAPQESEAPEAEEAAPAPQEPPSSELSTETAEPAVEEQPPIEPPRSWKAEEKERFKSLPRDTQEYLATREQERDREIRRSQNEAAEKLKGLTVREQQVEQARQQYENALPQAMQILQSQAQGEFADIKTINDVEKLAREDWPRYLQWDLSQKKIAALNQEMLAAQQRQFNERQAQFTEFAKKEDALFAEHVPDIADSVKAEKLMKAAKNTLEELGFSPQELADGWSGGNSLSLRDHRVQLLIHEAAQGRESKQKAKLALAKPVPPVQRPGVTPAKAAGALANIQNLEHQLANSHGSIQGARIVWTAGPGPKGGCAIER